MENTAGKIGRYQDIKYYIETKDYEYRTELLNGEIVGLASPSLEHQDIAIEMVGLFRQFIKKNDGKCRSYCAPTDVRLNFENIVVPDVFITPVPVKIWDGKLSVTIAEIILTESTKERNFPYEPFPQNHRFVADCFRACAVLYRMSQRTHHAGRI